MNQSNILEVKYSPRGCDHPAPKLVCGAIPCEIIHTHTLYTNNVYRFCVIYDGCLCSVSQEPGLTISTGFLLPPAGSDKVMWKHPIEEIMGESPLCSYPIHPMATSSNDHVVHSHFLHTHFIKWSLHPFPLRPMPTSSNSLFVYSYFVQLLFIIEFNRIIIAFTILPLFIPTYILNWFAYALKYIGAYCNMYCYESNN